MNTPSISEANAATRARGSRAVIAPYLVLIAVLAGVAALVTTVSVDREVLHAHSAETDFARGFAPEADRLSKGQPLAVDFHPPGYSAVLAAVNLLTHDLMTAGLWISAISSVIALACAFFLFRRLAGAWAGWGALAALALCVPFMAHSSMASSDVFFTALFLLLGLLMVRLIELPTVSGAVLLGLVCGYVMLVRTNGIVALLALGAPLLATLPRPRRLKLTAVAIGACILPLALWAWYSTTTGSPFVARANHVNLATSFYKVGVTAEEMNASDEQFASTWDVLTYDPGTVLQTIVRRNLQFPYNVARFMLWWPLCLVGGIGALMFLWRERRLAALAFAGLLVISVGLITWKLYESRYFLWLVPTFGAGVGYALKSAVDRLRLSKQQTAIALSVCAAVVVGSSVFVSRAAAQFVKAYELPDFVEAIPFVRELTPPTAWIVERKPMISFHAQRESWYIPEVDTVAEMGTSLCTELPRGRPAYLYIGAEERDFRETLTTDLARQPLPRWLKPLANGTQFDWQLYEIAFSAADC